MREEGEASKKSKAPNSTLEPCHGCGTQKTVLLIDKSSLGKFCLACFGERLKTGPIPPYSLDSGQPRESKESDSQEGLVEE